MHKWRKAGTALLLAAAAGGGVVTWSQFQAVIRDACGVVVEIQNPPATLRLEEALRRAKAHCDDNGAGLGDEVIVRLGP